MPKIQKIDYLEEFKIELENIDKLEQTPMIIREIAIQGLDNAIGEIIATGKMGLTKQSLENSKRGLENIGEQSIKNNFKIIYSQMCILAVSSLEATLKKYFEDALSNFSNINQANKDLKEIKISLAELVENNLIYSGEFGKLVLSKTNLSFQDLKSIKRIFSEYISYDIRLDSETEKQICFFLEARHVLVHKGGIADEKFIKSTNLFGANLKNYAVGDRIDVGMNDWLSIKNSFIELVEQLDKYKPKNNII